MAVNSIPRPRGVKNISGLQEMLGLEDHEQRWLDLKVPSLFLTFPACLFQR